MSFGKVLKNIRNDLGFDSARAFYFYLEEKATLTFNYSYYARIENDKTSPSQKVVNSICSLLEKKYADQIILAYCQQLFPQNSYLFNYEDDEKDKETLEEIKSDLKLKKVEQQELSLRQVNSIGKSNIHYFIFLIITLSRKSVTYESLEKRIGDEGFSKAISDLSDSKVIALKDGRLYSISSEMRFPKPESSQLRSLYAKLDGWDKDFSNFFTFNKNQDKFLIRRVTTKTKKIVESHCNLIIDLLKNSDEDRPELLDDVVIFNLNMLSGKLPG